MSENIKGAKRKIDYDAVAAYAAANSHMRQAEVAAHFKISQRRVSYILTRRGVRTAYRGRPLKPKPGQSAEQAHWENILHDAGLGMERGLRLRNQRIIYGFDTSQEIRKDHSATRQATS